MTVSSNDETAGAILRSAGALDRPVPVSDTLLAAWAEGRLDPERAALVEAHLAADDVARGVALALREEVLESRRGATSAEPRSDSRSSDSDGRAGPESDALPSLAAARARRSTWVPFAAAAAALLALGASFLASKSTTPTALGSDARLVAAADDLLRAEPELFRDFRPVGRAERRETVGDTTRSGLSILEPVGHVVSARPALRWASANGAKSFDVVVADSEGVVVWRTTTERSSIPTESLPHLEQGRAYVIEVNATGPFGRTTASRPFDVASAAAADSLSKAKSALLRAQGDDFGDLAFAHLAARRGFLTQAVDAVGAYLARHAKDADARDFDDYLRRRLGWPESR